jgi:hypothetical protein
MIKLYSFEKPKTFRDDLIEVCGSVICVAAIFGALWLMAIIL